MTTPPIPPGGGSPVGPTPPPAAPPPTGPAGTGPGDSITSADSEALAQLTTNLQQFVNVALPSPFISIADWFETVERQKLELYKAFQNNEFQDAIKNKTFHSTEFENRIGWQNTVDSLFLVYMSYSRNYTRIEQGATNANNTNFNGKPHSQIFDEYNSAVGTINSQDPWNNYNAALINAQVSYSGGIPWENVVAAFNAQAAVYNAQINAYNARAQEFNNMRADYLSKAQDYIDAINETNVILVAENVDRANDGLDPVPLLTVPTLAEFNIPPAQPILPQFQTLNGGTPGVFPSPVGNPGLQSVTNTIKPPTIPPNSWLNGFFTPVLGATQLALLVYEQGTENFIDRFDLSNVANSVLLFQAGKISSSEFVEHVLDVGGVKNSPSAGGISTMVLGLSHRSLQRVFGLTLIEEVISQALFTEGLDNPSTIKGVINNVIFQQVALASILSGTPSIFLLGNSSLLENLDSFGVQATLALRFTENLLSEIRNGSIRNNIQAQLSTDPSFLALSNAQQQSLVQSLTVTAGVQALSIGVGVTSNVFESPDLFLGPASFQLQAGIEGFGQSAFRNPVLESFLLRANLLREEARIVLRDNIARDLIKADITKDFANSISAAVIGATAGEDLSFERLRDIVKEEVLKQDIANEQLNAERLTALIIGSFAFQFGSISAQERIREEFGDLDAVDEVTDAIESVFEGFREVQDELIQLVTNQNEEELTNRLIVSFSEFLEEALSPEAFMRKMLKPGELLIGVMYEGLKPDHIMGMGSGADRGWIDIAA